METLAAPETQAGGVEDFGGSSGSVRGWEGSSDVFASSGLPVTFGLPACGGVQAGADVGEAVVRAVEGFFRPRAFTLGWPWGEGFSDAVEGVDAEDGGHCLRGIVLMMMLALRMLCFSSCDKEE